MIFCVAVDGIDSLFGVFENNLVNWLVLVGLIIWLCSKYVPPLLWERKARIDTSLSDAAKAKADSVAFFEAQKQRVANAENESKKLLDEARHIAQSMSSEIAEQTKKDMAVLERSLHAQLENERRLVVMQMRSIAARAAIKLAERRLPGTITDSVKNRLLGQFLEELGANNN